ncbi:MAG TPA: hypothetical protein DCE52_18830 [Rhodobacteraceae bacterium]|nr:hypothetical protein [Paracoccaceae bacterium]
MVPVSNVTLDHQYIHTDPARAAKTYLGGMIALAWGLIWRLRVWISPRLFMSG